MKYLKSDLRSADICVQSLKAGNIIIIPTDTVYGFSGIVDEQNNTDAKIRKIKGREETKPFIQLIAEPSDIKKYTDDVIPENILNLWPGPLTIIVKNKNSDVTTAYRCPDDEWLNYILKETGKPIYSTSANRSGHPILESIDEIENEFSDEVDVIIDDGDKKGGVASTIVSIGNGSVKILRQGKIKIN
ncbi:L-threonylcarbamoyladenylate synthase [Treponema sp.]|uniref:L-threonylcarbamoyladenylate synthase n=1 Tax=Treponema sp. TaxID=166 RepID=UPI00298D6277|nr:L-threonylcarbamoyladenylate synthase [Treponema sp.]